MEAATHVDRSALLAGLESLADRYWSVSAILEWYIELAPCSRRALMEPEKTPATLLDRLSGCAAAKPRWWNAHRLELILALAHDGATIEEIHVRGESLDSFRRTIKAVWRRFKMLDSNEQQTLANALIHLSDADLARVALY